MKYHNAPVWLRMALTKEEEEFLTPLPLLNDAAFKLMCEKLQLSDQERQFAWITIASYEMSKKTVGQH